jgi:hypothetical protein
MMIAAIAPDVGRDRDTRFSWTSCQNPIRLQALQRLTAHVSQAVFEWPHERQARGLAFATTQITSEYAISDLVQHGQFLGVALSSESSDRRFWCWRRIRCRTG